MFNITDTQKLHEVIVSQAIDLATIKAELAYEKSISSMWLDSKNAATKKLEELEAKREELQGAYDGLEELYAQRGDSIKELEHRLTEEQNYADRVAAGQPAAVVLPYNENEAGGQL